MKKAVLFLSLCALNIFLPPAAKASELYLIESQGPYIPPRRSLAVTALGGIDTGALPAAMLKPRAGYSPLDFLYIDLAPTFVRFSDTDDFLFVSWEASINWRLYRSKDKGGLINLYAKIHHTFAEPYTAQYQGSLPRVHTVLSPYTDTGIDITGGLSGFIPYNIGPQKGGLIYSADYSRTILRDYNPLFDSEEYKNRIFVNASPAIFFPFGKNENSSLTFLIQNRLTLWFARGFMYDFMPQINLSLGPIFSFVVGGTLPIIGGGVYKIQAASRMTLTYERDIHIVVRDIHFPPNKAILFGPENERANENRRIIDRLYKQLARYPEYSIVVEGHTSFVYWNDPVKGPIEQREELIPLSYARARAVVEALVERGIPRDRIKAVGKGGTAPLVPFHKLDKQWKNRRVEIHLHKDK